MLISVVALFFCPQVVHMLISVVALFFCPQVVHVLISVVALFFCPQVVHVLISVVALFFCPQVVHVLISVVVHVLISVVALFFCPQVVHVLISVVALFFCPQVVHVLISVVALFFVCLTPHRVLQAWLLLTTQENINPDVLGACVVFIRTLVYLNSTLNPVLYTLVSCKFRSALVRTLSGRGRKRGSTISSTRFTARTSTIKSCQSRKETLQMTDLMLVLQSEPKPPEHKLVLRKVNSTPF
ncbi:Hypp2284 [Branchiostoma lanceolatum]|uniref:Hypp2284 protein n=1 Tax=Branchiostoma lanceolatum TaxID=7740 RepID=A0A8K0ESL1_BRALA|nr:Hypp2284 [Branchiostoma lanceolatum]